MNEDKLKEECGVFGIWSCKNEDVTMMNYYGLYALQHRGQESSGIAVINGQDMRICKAMGLVSNLIEKESFKELQGKASIGHVRYSTTGESNIENAQPFIVDTRIGRIALAHNGNIINTKELKKYFGEKLQLESTSDSEIILKIIKIRIETGKDLEDAIVYSLKFLKGTYALTILTKDKLIGARDTKGIRPLCIGKVNENYVFSSESCAINTLGGELIRDVAAGEMVVSDDHGIRSVKFFEESNRYTCAFEYIYFAREDSIIDGKNVYEKRFLSGKELFKECPAEGDIVIGVPDSGIPAAIAYAEQGKIPYGVGLIKNKYVGRTFINPCKNARKEKVSIKLSPLTINIQGKRVIVVDDSMVRGTTARNLVKMLRGSGAKEIHFRIASPIVKYCCNFGIDIKSDKELIAYYKSIEDIRNSIGVDSIGFLSLNGLHKALGESKEFCFGCFSGEYPQD